MILKYARVSGTRRLFVLTVFLLTGAASCLFAQSKVLKGLVVDENNTPLGGAAVFLNKNLVIKRTDETGLFTLTVHAYDTVVVRKDKSKDQLFVPDYEGTDSLNVIFQVIRKTLVLDEITVSRSKVKKFGGETNDFIIDYYIYQDGSYLTLKRLDNKHFLEYYGSNKEIHRFELSFRPEELYIDCGGNSLLLSKDSVYQFWIDDNIHFSAVIIKKDFLLNVKSLVYCSDSIFINATYSNRNKNYHLNYSDKDTGYCFFTSFDTLRYYTIEEQISAYHAQTCPNPRINRDVPLKYQYIVNSQNRRGNSSSPIRNKIQPEFIALQINDLLNIQTLRVNQSLITVDFEKNLLYVFNNTGKTIYSTPIEGQRNERNSLLRDPYTNKFYVIDPIRPALGLSLLDVKTGSLDEILVLKEVFYPEKIKVFNDVLYFVAANSKGFNKLYMINLKNSVN